MESFGYDNKGNMTTDGTLTYEYYTKNQLTVVKQGATTIATYSYDFEGRRIKKVVGSVTTLYCYDGDQVIAEFENNVLKRKFVYGPGIDEPVCMIIPTGQANAGTYYYHYDGLGSVVALSNTNTPPQVVESYSYDAFGKLTGSSSIGNPYFFTARNYDTESGLYYYRARYYKTEIGRFLQTDPIGYAGGMNLYGYCENDPLNFIDPYGLDYDYFSATKGLGGQYIRNVGHSLAGTGVGVYNVGKGVVHSVFHPLQTLEGTASTVINTVTDPKGAVIGLYNAASEKVSVLFGDDPFASGRVIGQGAGNAALIVSIPNIGQWVKNPLLYEIGSKTLTTSKYTKLGLKGLSAIEKGRKIIQSEGWLGALRPTLFTRAYSRTIRQGLTPGGWIFIGGSLEAYGSRE